MDQIFHGGPAAAGFTERTFCRYFFDKPEVLIWRASELGEEIVHAINRAAEARPLDLVIGALAEARRFFDMIGRACLLGRLSSRRMSIFRSAN